MMSSSTLAVFLLSLVGFLAFDFGIFKKFAAGRQIVVVVGVTLLSLAFIIASRQGQPLGLPVWLKIPGWILTILGGSLLLYSVFIEIPLTLRQRQVDSPGDGATLALVQTGTYALCRHPGLLWLLLFLCGQVLVMRRGGMIQLAVMWMVFDLLLVLVQDRVIFPRRFSEYDNYRRSTPFLIPSRQSIHNASQSIGKTK